MKHLLLFITLAFSAIGFAQTPTWTQKENLPANSRNGAISFSIGTKVYLGLGSNNSDFYEYDTEAAVWAEKADLPLTTGLNNCSAFSIEGYGYVLTSRPYAEALPHLYRYDPASNSWLDLDLNLFDQNGATVNFEIINGSAVSFVINGKAYVGTGSFGIQGCGPKAHKKFYEYNPVTNTWRVLPPFPGDMRNFATGFALDGKGYIGSGRYYRPAYSGPHQNCPTISELYADFYRFDPITESWEAIENFPGGGRYGMVSFVIGDKAYVGGGHTGDDNFYTYDTENGWQLSTVFPGGLKRSGTATVAGMKAYYGTGFQNGASTVDLWEFSPSADLQGLASSGILSAGPFCPGATFTIGAISYGTINNDNVYNVLLSDTTGSFDNATVIGSMSLSVPSANIMCTLPESTLPGIYSLRLESTSPPYLAEIEQALQVYDVLPVQFIGAQQLCYNNTFADISGYNGVVAWYSEPEGGTPLSNEAPLLTDTYYASRVSGQCESARLAVPVFVESYITPPLPLSLTYCSITYISAANVSIPDGEPGTTKVWYSSQESTDPLPTFTILQQATYYVSYKKGGCESIRTPFEITINQYMEVPPLPSITVCYGAKLPVATQQLQDFMPSVSVVWYDSPNAINPLDENATLTAAIYYIKCVNGICQSTLIPLELNYLPIPSSPTGANLQYPAVPEPTLADFVVVGTNIEWYATFADAQTDTNPLPVSTPLSIGYFYYAIQTVNSCRSNWPLEVIFTPLAGLDSHLENSARIWPNPVLNELHFELSGNTSGIIIFNMLGQEVYNTKLNDVSEGVIDIKNLAPGTYFVKIHSKNGAIQSKIIKQ